MTMKVGVYRRWVGPVPRGRNGDPIPPNLWPQRRACEWDVRWFVVTPQNSSVRRSRSFVTKSEAETFRADLQSTLNRMPATRREAKRITVREFVEEFITLRTGPRGQRLKASTLALHSHALSRLADAVGRDTPLRSLTPMDATRFFADLRDGGTSAGTVNKLKCMLKAACSGAVQPFGYLSRNPFSGI